MVKRNRRNTRHRRCRRKTRATTRRARSTRKTQKGGNYLFSYAPPGSAAGILEQTDMPPRVMSEWQKDKIEKETDSA
jgi:hypothetical protein